MKTLTIILAGLVLVCLLCGIAGATDSDPYVFAWSSPATPAIFPQFVATDSSGNLYVTDSDLNCVRKYSSSGALLATWGSEGNGNGQFNGPHGIAVDSGGNVYVADTWNYRVQKFTTDGTYVAKWGSYGEGNGQFASAFGIVVDSGGNVYVADTYNYRIQKFKSDGTFVTKWGSEGSGNGQFKIPQGIAVDASGYVYVTDTNNFRVQKFTSAGAYVAQWGSAGWEDGQFVTPQGIAVDASGYVYVVDSYNYRIQKFTSSGSYVAQWGSYGSGMDNFKSPFGIAVDTAGNVYVADRDNRLVKKYTSTGTFLSYFGMWSGDNGQYDYSHGAAVNSTGYIYVADTNNNRIQVIAPDGTYVSQWGSDPSGGITLQYPQGVAVNSSDYVYVADTSSSVIDIFTPGGEFITQWGGYGSGDGELNYPGGIAVNASGYVYVADSYNYRIQVFTPGGEYLTQWGTSGTGDGQFDYVNGIAVDGDGNVYTVDTDMCRVQKFAPGGMYLTQWGSRSSEAGKFLYPYGIAVGADNNVFVADTNNNRVQVFTSDGAFITKWGSYGYDNGKFRYPQGIAVDSPGNVYVVDTQNFRLQKFTPNPIPSASFVATPTYGTSPLKVAFTSSTTGSPTGYNWTFGDGDTTNATEKNPIHTYTALGLYDVSLRVTNANGESTTTRSSFIRVAKNSQIVPLGGTIATGESFLEISTCNCKTYLAWWSPGADPTSWPTYAISYSPNYNHYFTANPSLFSAPYTGNWYQWEFGQAMDESTVAFRIVEPSTEVQVRDLTTSTSDVTDKIVPVGDELGFRLTTNIAGIATERGMDNGVPFNINVRRPDGVQLMAVINKTGYSRNLTNMRVFSPTINTGGIWNTEDSRYPTGNYSVQAESTLNGMTTTYQDYGLSPDGKSRSVSHSVTLSSTKFPTVNGPTVKEINQSLGYPNSVVDFAITGSNFVPGKTYVQFRNLSSGLLAANLTNVTATRITGSLTIPENASVGSWNVRVVVTNKGETTLADKFTIQALPGPMVSSVSLTSGTGVRTERITFKLQGTNFQTGSGNTYVTIYNYTWYTDLGHFVNMTPTLTSVKSGEILGTFIMPDDAPLGNYTWQVNVTTTSGGKSTSNAYIPVKGLAVAPVVGVIKPDTADQNSTVPFTLAGSNFQIGTAGTTVRFYNATYFLATGNNLTAKITKVDSKSITGYVTIPGNATLGSKSWIVNVTTVDGGESIAGNTWFTVTQPVPAIKGLTLTSGTGVRTERIVFKLTGTNFQPGIENTSVTLSNWTWYNDLGYFTNLTPTLTSVKSGEIIGTFIMPNDAPLGNYTWGVNVTTINGNTSTEGNYWIGVKGQTIAPVVGIIKPDSADQNSTVPFTLAGSNFQIGTAGTTVKFYNATYFLATGNNLTAKITKVDSKSITGYVTIPGDATLGSKSWIVNVTTVDGRESTTGNTWFTVTKPVPTIGTFDKTAGIRTEVITFNLGGTNFQPDLRNTSVTLYNATWSAAHSHANLTSTLTSVTTTAIKGNFTIPADSPFGNYTWLVNVTTVTGGTSTNKNIWFAVNGQQKAPVVTRISPETADQNSTVLFTLSGSSFQIGTAGTTVKFYNKTYFDATGINLSARITRIDSKSLTAYLSIPGNATPGIWLVNVTTVDGNESTSGNIRFIVNKPRPTVTGLSVTGGNGFRTELITFKLQGTNFQPGVGNTTVILSNYTWYHDLAHNTNMSAMLTSVKSEEIIGTFRIPRDSPLGNQTWLVNVTTLNGNASRSGNYWLSVRGEQAAPVVKEIKPDTADQNSTLAFTLTGTNFQLGKAGSNVSFYNRTYFLATGIMLYAEVKEVTGTSIKGTVGIPGNATFGPGSWIVNVTTIDCGTSRAGNVRLTVNKPVPTVTSVDKKSGARSDLITFKLQGTNFQPGVGNTTVTLYNRSYFNDHHANLTASLTSVTSGAITGTFTVPADAPSGKIWIVNVTTVNGNTSTSGNVWFTEIERALTVQDIKPAEGLRNGTIAFTINGNNFQPDLTSVNFTRASYPELNVTVYAVTPTRITGAVSIPGTMPIGTWTVNVTSPEGGTVKTKTFTVKEVQPPTIKSISPAFGYRDSTVFFFINGTNFQPGGRTIVTFWNETSSTHLDTSLDVVYSGDIAGRVNLPPGAITGPWNVNVTTDDGGIITVKNKFAVR